MIVMTTSDSHQGQPRATARVSHSRSSSPRKIRLQAPGHHKTRRDVRYYEFSTIPATLLILHQLSQFRKM